MIQRCDRSTPPAERSFLIPSRSRPETPAWTYHFCSSHDTCSYSPAGFGRDRAFRRLRTRASAADVAAGKALAEGCAGVSRRRRRFANAADAVARRRARRIRPMAARVFSLRLQKERSDGADRRVPWVTKRFAISAPTTPRFRRPRLRLSRPTPSRRPAKSLRCSTTASHVIPTIIQRRRRRRAPFRPARRCLAESAARFQIRRRAWAPVSPRWRTPRLSSMTPTCRRWRITWRRGLDLGQLLGRR